MIKNLKNLSIFIAVGTSFYFINLYSSIPNIKYMYYVGLCVIFLFTVSLIGIFRSLVFRKNDMRSFTNIEINELNNAIKKQEGIIDELGNKIDGKDKNYAEMQKMANEYKYYLENVNVELDKLSTINLSKNKFESIYEIFLPYANSLIKILNCNGIFVYVNFGEGFKNIFEIGRCKEIEFNEDLNLKSIKAENINSEAILESVLLKSINDFGNMIFLKNHTANFDFVMIVERIGNLKFKEFDKNYSKILFNLMLKNLCDNDKLLNYKDEQIS